MRLPFFYYIFDNVVSFIIRKLFMEYKQVMKNKKGSIG